MRSTPSYLSPTARTTRGSRPGRVVATLVVAVLCSLVALTGAAGAASADGVAPPIRPRIVGGKEVPFGAYRFQSAILDLTIHGTDYDRQICGATLIAPTWVLTAAHCVEEGSFVTAPADMQILVGRTDLNRKQGERHDVAAIYPSPKFDEVTDSDDVALIQLTTPSAITPIRLAQRWDDPYEVAGTMLRVIGWGDTIPVPPHQEPTELSYPHRMQEVDVPVVADSTCNDVYQTNHTPIVASKTVCAGAEGIDACFGDSGGPLFATTPSGYVQIGIVASGEGCAAAGFPGTYTEVNALSVKRFIASTMAAHP